MDNYLVGPSHSLNDLFINADTLSIKCRMVGLEFNKHEFISQVTRTALSTNMSLEQSLRHHRIIHEQRIEDFLYRK